MAEAWYVEYSFKQHAAFHEVFQDHLRSARQASPASRRRCLFWKAS